MMEAVEETGATGIRSIKCWPRGDQPRNRLLAGSAGQLTDTELLAILVNNGTRGEDAVAVSRSLLEALQGDIGKLARLSPRGIVKLGVRGIGLAKAVTIAAAMELGSRREALPAERKAVGRSSEVAAFLRSRLALLKHEAFAVVFLNKANRINHFEVVSAGGITGTIADPRIILKKALEHDAVSLILSHNHPSGNFRPSPADEQVTRKISQAASLLDIRVLDHIIVSEDGYFSFADEGMI